MLNYRLDKKITLSVCIPTLNRAEYISETLDSITNQLQSCVEIVIVDGGSTDNTESIIKEYQEKFESIRYFKKSISNNFPSNEGFDRDCSESVELATGDYCWLMTDDDLIQPDAINIILEKISERYELIILNSQIANKDISEVLLNKRPDINSDQIYNQNLHDWNSFAGKIGNHITFVGAVVIKRKHWLERNKSQYFGTGFVHVGVIFQESFEGKILVMSEPLVIIRYGNAHWSGRAFKIWMYDWPKLIWSFNSLSDEAKLNITFQKPWEKFSVLLRERALGNYSITQFNQYIRKVKLPFIYNLVAKMIAIIPRRPLYYLAILFIILSSRNIELNKFRLNESWNRGNV